MYRYSRFSYFASRAARIVAHPGTFLAVLAVVLIWLIAGPFVGYNGAWQVIFSMGATVVTFLLLFLIQHTQSREMAAIQLKLNDLIRSSEGTHNALLDIEELTDRDYDQIKASYTLLAQQAREQLRGGKFRWATARISMETFDSLLDVAEREAAAHGMEAEPNSLPDTSTAAPGVGSPAATHTAPQSLEALDRLTRIGAKAVRVPMALISVVDGEKQWLKSQQGLHALYHPSQRLPVSQFLVAAIVQTGKPLLIEDVSTHPVARQDTALSDLSIRAVAAFPLFSNRAAQEEEANRKHIERGDANGTRIPQRVIGVFSVFDTQPRHWTPAEISLLQDLAAVAAEQEEAVTVPYAVAPPVGSVPETTATGEAPLHSETASESAPKDTILVVDDSQTNRLLLTQRLIREGYRVQTAADGAEALVLLQQEPVALVLLDVMMPGMDGEQALEQMQSDEKLRQIPVVMISALDEQASVTRCLQMGARDYLLKPFDPAQLQARIRTYLHAEKSAPLSAEHPSP